MQRLVLLILCLIMLVPLGAAAQEGTRYEDPEGRFSVVVPDGWEDLSTAEMAHFYSRNPPVSLYVIAQPEAEALISAGQNITSPPVQTVEAPLSNGLWTQKVYVQAWDIVVTLSQGRDGVVVTVIMRGQQGDMAAVNPVILDTIQSVGFGEGEPPPYADRAAFSEQEITLGPDSAPLGGTISMPNGTGPFPAVVIVHGSGPNDRDGTTGPNKLYRDIAWGLASQGIAVLRYDKRTLIYPEAFATPNATIREESIDDTLAAVALLRSLPTINPNRIYVLGHSLGGGVAPPIAQEDGQLAGLIIMAGSNRSLLAMVVDQAIYLGGLDGELSADERAQLDELQAIIDQLDSLPDDAAILGAYVTYWRDLERIDTLGIAQALNLPMLILQGGRDYQVTEADFERWQEALSGRSFVQFILYPTLNHLFMVGEGAPNPQEYYVPAYADGQVINDIVLWIQEQQ